VSASRLTGIPKLGWTLVAIGLVMSISASAQEGDNERLPAEVLSRLRAYPVLSAEEKLSSSQTRAQVLIRKALDLSPSVQEAKFALDAAEQDIQAAKGSRQPQVTATGSSQANNRDLPAGSQTNWKPYLNLTATLPIYDWGRIAALVGGREAARDAAAARYRQQRNQVAGEVVITCLEYTKQRALIAAADDYYETVRKLVDMLTRITEADTGRAGELVQARSRQLQAQQARENARSKVREQLVRLRKLLGGREMPPCEGLEPALLKRLDVEELIGRIKRTPQIQGFESDYAAQLRQIEQISATRKPQVQLSATHAPVVAGLTDQYFQAVTMSVTMPIYDGRILQSNERAAVERANALGSRVEQTYRQLESEYRERYEQASANLRRADEYINLIAINDRVRKDFFIQWSSLGRRSLFELLAIEQEQYNLQTGYFTSLFDGLIANANVMASVDLIITDQDTPDVAN
jgi:adhesin transport system outer membrane protein